MYHNTALMDEYFANYSDFISKSAKIEKGDRKEKVRNKRFRQVRRNKRAIKDL